MNAARLCNVQSVFCIVLKRPSDYTKFERVFCWPQCICMPIKLSPPLLIKSGWAIASHRGVYFFDLVGHFLPGFNRQWFRWPFVQSCYFFFQGFLLCVACIGPLEVGAYVTCPCLVMRACMLYSGNMGNSWKPPICRKPDSSCKPGLV